MLDTIIQNVRIIDGTNAPWYRADIGIKDGKISKIGTINAENSDGNASAAEVIAGQDLYAAPGFIDIHSHSDTSLMVYPQAESRILQGITTEIGGNCGLSAAPVSYDEEKKERLRALLRQSLADGAFAMSSGLIYPPGCYADKDELTALCAKLPAYHAFYATHMREEGLQVTESVHEAIEICARSGAPLQISHHKVTKKDAWKYCLQELRILHAENVCGMTPM